MLNEKQLKLISDATLKKTGDIGLKHAKENAKYIKKTIRDLKRSVASNESKPSFLVSAGPSLHKRRSIHRIKQANFNGHIVAVDGSLGHCLRNGLVPDFVITVDPDPHRIIRWFGDPKLAERPQDDYFRRQDLDPALNRDEVERNIEMIGLLNRYGSKINVIISTSVSPEIAVRCLDAGMELYWWNPLYDDFEDHESYSYRIYQITGAPCMVTGGNCGTSAWAFSHSILKSPDVIMVGMDFSYPPGTNIVNTQYYEHLLEIMPENPEDGILKVYNPYLGETWLTDPAYYWYNHNFREMAKIAPCRTFNCTEGGILFGENIEFCSLDEALSKIR